MWKNNRPDDWKTEFDCSVCDVEPEGCPGCGSNAYEAGADAMLNEVALKLKEIYGIPDLKMEHDRMGEFIQEIMGEVG